MFIAFFVALVLFVNGCNSIEDGWKTIKPLSTNRKSVEKLLGNPKIDTNGYYSYLTDDAYIQINYSSQPCVENSYKRGEYNVPENTVLSYIVNIKKPIKLSELDFKANRYHEDSSGDVLNFVDLVNVDDGIVVSLTIRDRENMFEK